MNDIAKEGYALALLETASDALGKAHAVASDLDVVNIDEVLELRGIWERLDSLRTDIVHRMEEDERRL